MCVVLTLCNSAYNVAKYHLKVKYLQKNWVNSIEL